jgi:small subunit ribosomal protein S2
MSTTEKNTALIDKLFQAGAHFGFSKSRRHPSVKEFVFTNKDGNDIFDLEKTAVAIDTAAEALLEAGKNGKNVIFVSTKEETKRLVLKEAERAEAPYVVHRWIGGMFTNFSEIRKRIARLKQLTEEGASGELERKYTKRERVVIGREVEKLTFNFGGIKTIEKTPDMMVVVDPRHDIIAVTEALDIGIPVIAIAGSDTNIEKIAHPIVTNDALQSSVTTILEVLTDAYLKGKAEYVPKKPVRTATRRSSARAA